MLWPVRVAVPTRWQFAHTDSHFAISALTSAAGRLVFTILVTAHVCVDGADRALGPSPDRGWLGRGVGGVQGRRRRSRSDGSVWGSGSPHRFALDAARTTYDDLPTSGKVHLCLRNLFVPKQHD
jgi:hypothetical protein